MSTTTAGGRSVGESALDRQVVLGGLRSVAHEMAVTVENCAISQVVRDSLDFSTAVFDEATDVISVGTTSMKMVAQAIGIAAFMVGGVIMMVSGRFQSRILMSAAIGAFIVGAASLIMSFLVGGSGLGG